MKRYLKLYKVCFKINLKTIASYDYDVLLGIIGMIIKNLINIIMLYFIFDSLDNIVGYNFSEILFIYSLSLISYAIWHCFFINTLTIPYYIKDGTFDNFLLRPVNPIFSIMMDGFDEDGWADLLIGIVLLMISSQKLNIIDIRLLLVIPIAICGGLIYAGITFILSSFCFFTIENSGMANLVTELHDFAKYPITIFSKPLQFILCVCIPIAFTAYFPSLFFLSHYTSSFIMVLLCFGVTFLFFTISILFWRYALKHYTSSGS